VVAVSILAYDFMVRALIAALVTGLAAPTIGTYLVQRRLSLMGDGIGHIAVTGVALGLLTHRSPVGTAVVVSMRGAVLIEVVREYGQTGGDLALALIFYGGIAAGLLLIGVAGGNAATLYTYLFGSITTVSATDVTTVAILALVVMVGAVGFAPQLFTVCQDEDFAKVSGLRVRLYCIAISVMAAITVTVAMRTVGLLLVSALMVVPVAAAQQLTRGFKATMAIAVVVGVAASVGGVVTSFYVNAAPGATIVLLALAGFVAAWPLGVALRRGRRHRRVRDEAVPLDATMAGQEAPNT
jgi:zinc transport system permease protein